MEINRLSGPFGVEVTDLDVASCTDEQLKTILLTVYDERLVVIRTNALTDKDFVHFGHRAGIPLRFDENAVHPELFHLTNISTEQVKDNMPAENWHSDLSFTKIRPSFTILYSVSAPREGGETRFCDLAAAYEDLSESKKSEIEELLVEHRNPNTISGREDRARRLAPKDWDDKAVVLHPLVRKHPITGRKTLFAIGRTPVGIRGMSDKAAKALLSDLCDHALKDPFLSSHRHRTNDLVIWDNPTTLHRATPLGTANGPFDTRIIRRMSLMGTPSVFR
jgi:taurine dioxygenase